MFDLSGAMLCYVQIRVPGTALKIKQTALSTFGKHHISLLLVMLVTKPLNGLEYLWIFFDILLTALPCDTLATHWCQIRQKL